MRAAIVTLVFAVACGGPQAEKQAAILEGKAAWYGGKFQGRKTASGERFDKRKLTAAHRKLPFGTQVKVTNLNNRKSVVVRINDRGPYGKGRIIDLSEAAAKQIDMIRAGVVIVRVKVLKLPPPKKNQRKRKKRRKQ